MVARHRARRAGAEQLAVLPSARADGARTRRRGHRPRGAGAFDRAASTRSPSTTVGTPTGAAGTSTTTCRSRSTPTGWSLAASGLGDRDAAARYVERARRFAPEFQHWFARDGGAVPFGRSLTYRMAQGSFWGALALADVDALDWPQVRGFGAASPPLVERTADQRSRRRGVGRLRLRQPPDGRVVQLGGSPYWCMKAFTMLAAPDDHPFWTVAEARHPPPATVTLPTPGMVLGRDDGQVVALMAQPPGWSFVEQAEAKYHKFAYSSRFGFSGDFTMYGLGRHRLDAGGDRPGHRCPPRARRRGAQRGGRRRGPHPLDTDARCARRHRARRRRALARARAPHVDRSRARAVRDRVRAPVGAGRLRTTGARRCPSAAAPSWCRAWGGSTVVDLSDEDRRGTWCRRWSR